MSSRALLTSMLAAFVIAKSPAARAQSGHALGHAQLAPGPALKLSWPIAPRSFTVTTQSLSLFGLPSLELYEAQSLWLRRGPVTLLTFGSASLASELDCRLTCQPVLQNSSGVGTRFSLPVFVPQLAESHAFVRLSEYQTSLSPRVVGLVHAGLASAFNF